MRTTETYKIKVTKISEGLYRWNIIKNGCYSVGSGTAISRKEANERADQYIEKLLGNFDFR